MKIFKIIKYLFWKFQKLIVSSVKQDFSQESIAKIWFSYFSIETYVVGTQKNRLNETVLLSNHNICYNEWVRKYLQFYAENFCLFKPVVKENIEPVHEILALQAQAPQNIGCLHTQGMDVDEDSDQKLDI